MSDPIFKGDFSIETQTGEWERQFAFGSLSPAAVIFHAPFQQLTNSYARPSDSGLASYNINGVTCYFCDDVGFTDKRAKVAEWIREIASLPANFNDYESYSYAFPGYYAERAPLTKAPTSKMQKEFFLVGNTGAGANYATAGDIPQYFSQNYLWAYAYDSFSLVNNVVTSLGSLIQLDGILANTNINVFLFGSTPNLATWKGWAATDNANVASFSIEAADSVLEHVRGPIWCRTRRFIKAQ